MSNSTPNSRARKEVGEPIEAPTSPAPSPKPRRRSKRKATGRPEKPYADFPLYAHPLGYWSKKVAGTIRYFGRWGRVVKGKMTPVPYVAGWQEALNVYKAQVDDLQAGRAPRVKLVDGKLTQADAGFTIRDLCNAFTTAKHASRDAGEIGERMLAEYRATTDLIVATFDRTRRVEDLQPEDFEALRKAMAEKWGPTRLGNEIQKVRTVLKYAYDAGKVDRPVRVGPQFKKPTAGVMRRHRAKRGENMLEAAELRKLLDKASGQLRAMILLGCNAGFGNHDLATLPLEALDLDAGWVCYPRPKTGIPRRCPLWPETSAALREAIAQRPTPKDPAAAGLVFITSRGRPWLNAAGIANPVSVSVRALMKAVGIHGEGIGPYTLRHVFRTIADAARDPVAIDLIMGHGDPSMGGRYRERIEGDRLVAVAEHVRAWLFGKADGPKSSQGAEPVASEPAEDEAGTEPESADARPARRPLRLYVAG